MRLQATLYRSWSTICSPKDLIEHIYRLVVIVRQGRTLLSQIDELTPLQVASDPYGESAAYMAFVADNVRFAEVRLAEYLTTWHFWGYLPSDFQSIQE